jgi:hypothetical protein
MPRCISKQGRKHTRAPDKRDKRYWARVLHTIDFMLRVKLGLPPKFANENVTHQNECEAYACLHLLDVIEDIVDHHMPARENKKKLTQATSASECTDSDMSL